MTTYSVMRTTTAVFLLTLSVILMAGTPPEPTIVSKLDECIQRRFLDGRAFGMSRVAGFADAYHITRKFIPENPTEDQAVSQLKKDGYEVAIFLAGRNIFSKEPNRYGVRSHVQGPAIVASARQRSAFPAADELLSESRTAFASFQKGAGYTIQKGEWTVAMRPLRASSKRCVQCHTNGPASAGATVSAPKIGDALGVAMYVYRRGALRHE